jgi:HD-GYP domain-containing protein (c-di-GMP phosphodiesterase class II)
MYRWVHELAQDRRLLRAWLTAVAALVVPPSTLALLHRFPQYDLVFESVDFHLAIVASISACAFVVALAAAVAARRTGQGALVVLAVGCLAVGAFMLAHGLTTPGTMGRPVNAWVSRFPVLAIAAFATCLTLAAIRAEGWFLAASARRASSVLVGSGLLLTAVSVVAVIWPQAGIGSQLLPGETWMHAVLLAVSAGVLFVSGSVHWRRYRLGPERVQLALVVASWQGAGAALSLELGELWHLAWWDYHAFLLVGFAAAAYAVIGGSRRRRPVDEVLGTAFATDPLEHIERGYSDALRVLVGAVEARDEYTHGHSTRVAGWTVALGHRLGQRPSQLRTLAEGAYLHDVGKIGVPDHILNKPGALDQDEWDWIREHPVVGVDIASRAPSLHRALDMIRHHHERFDGTGYPDGLAGEQIPLSARIVAIADVWDALTSERAYRAAWSPERALAHLLAGRGTHFDPRCLDAFVALLEERGLRLDGSGEAGVAVAAANACHRQHADHTPLSMHHAEHARGPRHHAEHAPGVGRLRA